jgi:hypothetical protein
LLLTEHPPIRESIFNHSRQGECANYKEKTMFAIESFTAAVSAKELKRATDIASLMTANFKDVAREIWTRWVTTPAPF